MVQELRFKLILQVVTVFYAKYPEQMVPNPIFRISLRNSPGSRCVYLTVENSFDLSNANERIIPDYQYYSRDRLAVICLGLMIAEFTFLQHFSISSLLQYTISNRSEIGRTILELMT